MADPSFCGDANAWKLISGGFHGVGFRGKIRSGKFSLGTRREWVKNPVSSSFSVDSDPSVGDAATGDGGGARDSGGWSGGSLADAAMKVGVREEYPPSGE